MSQFCCIFIEITHELKTFPVHNVRRQLSQWNFSKVAISKIILLIQTQFHMFFIAIIAWQGNVAAGLNVFYRVILLKLPCATIKNLMCAMLPDCTVMFRSRNLSFDSWFVIWQIICPSTNWQWFVDWQMICPSTNWPICQRTNLGFSEPKLEQN